MSITVAAGHSGALHDRRHGVLRELALPAMFGAAVLFFSAAMLLGVNISAMRGNLGWIELTQKILIQISEAERGVVGDELTVRSFALTGDPRFLEYQQLERRRLTNAVDALDKLAAVEPGGPARMRAVRETVGRHTAIYTGITGFGPDKAAVVGETINDDAKRTIMFRAREALAEYRAEEIRVLGVRQQKLTAQLSQAFVLAIGIILAAFVLGGLGLLMAQLRIPVRR
jgi:CHASE3 domain sensor protein